MKDADEYLSMNVAAAKLGWRGTPTARAKRLLRVLQAKERSLQVQIVFWTGGQGRGARPRVTMRLLRRHCRELFLRAPDELAKDFRRYLERIDERIDDRIDVLVTPQLEELRAVDEEIILQVKNLGMRLSEPRKEKPEESKRSHGSAQG